jgi:hypothetical protein
MDHITSKLAEFERNCIEMATLLSQEGAARRTSNRAVDARRLEKACQHFDDLALNFVPATRSVLSGIK